MAVKTTKKKTVTKVKEKETVNRPSSSQVKNTFYNTVKNTKYLLLAGVLLLFGVLFLLRSFFVAATVNGEPILRISLIKELEKQGGKRTLDNQVTKTLILQEAKKQNVTVEQKEVDQEIAKAEEGLKKQGQTLDGVLALQGMTKQDLLEQIRFEKLIEKLISKDIQVTDKEVEDFMQANKDSFPESSDSAQLKNQAQEQLRRQKINQTFQAWITELQKKAKINYFVQY